MGCWFRKPETSLWACFVPSTGSIGGVGSMGEGLDWAKAGMEERSSRQSGMREIRRPKAESRKKAEIRRPKVELENSARFEPMDLNLAKKRWR